MDVLELLSKAYESANFTQYTIKSGEYNQDNIILTTTDGEKIAISTKDLKGVKKTGSYVSLVTRDKTYKLISDKADDLHDNILKIINKQILRG